MTYYLIVNCGYTARLVKHVRKMIPKPIFIWDNLQGDGLYCYQDPEEAVKLSKIVGYEIKSGTICFKYDNPEEFDIIETIKMLQGFRHCAFFYIDDTYGWDEDEDGEDTRRMITNEDLKSFDNKQQFGGDEYYCGTLYKCKHIEKDDMNITFMTFDTESG